MHVYLGWKSYVLAHILKLISSDDFYLSIKAQISSLSLVIEPIPFQNYNVAFKSTSSETFRIATDLCKRTLFQLKTYWRMPW